MSITPEEIRKIQEEWKKGILEISKAYQMGQNYRELAENFLKRLYAYDYGIVLFKPTLAREVPFRLNFESALSYFIGGKYPEDIGFALQNFREIEFEIAGEIYFQDIALSQGKYLFYLKNSEKAREVEFTFVYKKFEGGLIKIIAHHSSIPYGAC